MYNISCQFDLFTSNEQSTNSQIESSQNLLCQDSYQNNKNDDNEEIQILQQISHNSGQFQLGKHCLKGLIEDSDYQYIDKSSIDESEHRIDNQDICHFKINDFNQEIDYTISSSQ